MVAPSVLKKTSPLGNISDVYNGVLVRGSDLGDVMFYGKGAGKAPTASAVLSDVIDAVSAGGNIRKLGWVDAAHDTLIDYRNDNTAVMIRVAACDKEKAVELFGCEKEIEGVEDYAFFTPVLNGYKLEELKEKAKEQGVELLCALRVLDY